MEEQKGVEKPVSSISEIDLVYNDRMSRIEGSKIKGIRKDGNNLILEMAEEENVAESATEKTMIDAIKNNEQEAEMPSSSMDKSSDEEKPAMESHVENADTPVDQPEEVKKENSLMDKIKKMTGV